MLVLEGGARVELGEVLNGLQDVIWREMGTLIQ